MRDRLRARADELPAGPASGAVKDSVERELGNRFDAGYRKILEVLTADRYFRLLDDLEDFRDNPPVRPLASGPAGKVAAKRVTRRPGGCAAPTGRPCVPGGCCP